MDLFNLQASITLDTSSYERSASDAVKNADKIEKAFDSVGDTAKQADNRVGSLGDEIKDTGSVSEKAAKSADGLADEIEDIGDTSSSASKSVGGLGDDIDGVGKSSEESEKGIDGLGESIGKAVLQANLFEKGLGLLAGAVKALASYVWNLDEATEEYRVAQGKLNTAFKAAGLGAGNAKKAYRDLYKVVGDTDRATEASQLLAQLATNSEDIAAWTEIATGVVGTFGDSLPIESLIEAANETANVGKVTGTLADALTWAGINEDDFNGKLAQCNGTAEATNLITDTLGDTYREAASAFRENNKAVMEARDAFTRLAEAEADIGEETSRVKNALATGFAPELEHDAKAVDRFMGKVADMLEKWSDSKTAYLDGVRELERKIDTGSIEEVVVALEELRKEKTLMKEQGGLHDVLGKLNIQEQQIYREAVDEAIAAGEAQLETLTATAEAMDENAEAAENLADKVIASASGISVELEGTGLTAEEASSRLQTYTDAALDMFSQINTKSELTYQNMIDNLEANIQATEDFANNLASISGEIPAEMSDMFAAGGPAMYAGVVKMLAEANNGVDEGLTRLNAAWEDGGKAAVDAFVKSLGAVPADTENPATIVAAQMEQDTSMEIAADGVVDRTYTAFTTAVDSAGFDSAGKTAMQKFIDGMEAKRSDVIAKAQSIANDAKNKINAALNGIGSGSGRYSAGGLDYVPYNNYPAVLHAGEAVLTAQEAQDWRSGRRMGGNIYLTQNITAVPQTPVELAAATEAYFEQARWAI